MSNYLDYDTSIRSWLTTTDHKRIGVLYMVSITLFFFLGAVAILLVRLHLASPDLKLLAPDVYNRLFTLHGVVMVWFFLIPSIPSVFGNFLVPLMIGAKDVAFPRLNLASWYVFLAGGIITLVTLFEGGIDTGWTFYTPFSSLYSNSYVLFALAGVVVSGFSSIFTGLNFITTVHTMRAPGMTWMRLPLFIWAIYATSIVLVIATPVLAMTLLFLALERIFHVGIFDPKIGGDPLLFQHLFWFYSHPAVYIMILPGMGVTSELISCFSRNKIFGYKFIAYSSVAIALLGFLLWGHHMFVSGQSIYSNLAFSFLSFLIAIPSALKVFNWTATLFRAQVMLLTPFLYAAGFVGLFTIGGLTGLFLASLALDIHLHDTYFVVAHFHFIMVGGTLMAYLGAVHYWWPKMSGKLYREKLGRFAAAFLFFGFLLTFFPQFILGFQGMPRRYYVYQPEFHMLNVISTIGTVFLAVGYLMPLYYLLDSLVHGAAAPANPWNATGLEWRTPSPPPSHNFDVIPTISEDPYEYQHPTVQDPQHAT